MTSESDGVTTESGEEAGPRDARHGGTSRRRMLGLTGAIDRHTWWGFAVLAPAAVVGYLLSNVLNRHLNPKRLRWLAIGVSAAGAIVLIARELLAF